MSPLPSTIQIPCRSHHGCTYHRHWSSPCGPLKPDADAANTNAKSKNSGISIIANNTAGCVQPDDVERNRLKRVSLFSISGRSKSEVGPGAGEGRGKGNARAYSSIEQLPTELLLCISTHLNAIEQASLALTCRSLGSALGPLAWKKASKTGVASWYRHAEMLDVLQRDMKSEEWWRCAHCVAFHPRRKAVPKDPSTRFVRVCEKLTKGPLKMLAKTSEKSLCIGMAKDPLYIIDLNLIQGVMDRHFLGSPYGVCLNALKCEGSRTFPISDTANMLLKYEFAPKIVLDRLLLRSNLEFSIQRTMFIRNVVVGGPSIRELVQQSGFWMCGHEQVGSALRGIGEESEPPRVYQNMKCQYCPTHYNIRTPGKTCISIRVWQNLGSGRNAGLRQWTHLSRREKQKLRYDWGMENIPEAFERILCSTTKEFKKQLSRSDGLGNWYDPELQTRAYKTLPEKIAERLSVGEKDLI